MSDFLEIAEWNPTALRRQALDVTRAASGGDAVFFRIVRTDGGLRYVDTQGSGDVGRVFLAQSAKPVLPDNITSTTQHRDWSAARPAERHTNRFATFFEDYGCDVESMYDVPVGQAVYKPGDISDQVRALMYAGGEFLGYVGTFRQGGELFRPREMARIRSVTAVVHRLTLLARHAECLDQAPACGMHLIADEYGRLQFADHRARAWLTARRSDLLERALKQNSCFVVDGMACVSALLANGAMPLHHVVLTPDRPLHRDALAGLSATQRQIVELASGGLTNEEIALIVGVSESTVKYHLGLAYRQMNIRGRQELITRSERGKFQ